MPDKTAFLCPCCETETSVSATELYEVKKKHYLAAIVCCSVCGSASTKLLVGELPESGDLSLEKWSEKLAYDGESNWLPCLKFEGPEAKLVSGCYVAPGNELTPRLWLYRTADLTESPSGNTWWTWEEYIKEYLYDPFIKLYRMRMPGNRNWLSFMTKGAAEKLEDMHLRTRIVPL